MALAEAVPLRGEVLALRVAAAPLGEAEAEPAAEPLALTLGLREA